jgi:hypothetical protein
MKSGTRAGGGHAQFVERSVSRKHKDVRAALCCSGVGCGNCVWIANAERRDRVADDKRNDVRTFHYW